MSECKFKDLLQTECELSGPKRKAPHTLNDFSSEQWKEKLWLAGMKNQSDVPSDISICKKHNAFLNGKFRNKLCCDPLSIHEKSHKCKAG